MDDIQFWLYLAFALIYFITRSFKKKEPKKPAGGSSPRQESSGPERKPVTFEELLKEFTEGREAGDEREEVTAESRQKAEEEEWLKKQRETEEEEVFEEGRTRRFSDEESKRIYEESIRKVAENSPDFKSDEHFRSKLVRVEAQEETHTLAEDIRDMLQDQEDVKKAIVMSEILNRKY